MEQISVGDGETVTTQAELIEANGTIGVSVVQVPIPTHPIQVQSVIQQPSVIQTATGQTIQVGVGSDGDGPTEDESDARKRREVLARRPSYRKIFNDLSSDPAATLAVSKIEEESNSSDDNPEAGDAGSDLTNSAGAVTLIQDSSGTVVPAQAIQLASHDGSTPAGLQTLTMTNASSANASSTGGATIVQYAQGPEGQFFIPVTLSTSGSVQYQIATTPSALPQSVVMATTGNAISGTQQVGEEASRKRELRLLKNREAARECRRKKKEYVKCLENRVAVLENQNKALIEELKSLKELYCQKEG